VHLNQRKKGSAQEFDGPLSSRFPENHKFGLEGRDPLSLQ